MPKIDFAHRWVDDAARWVTIRHDMPTYPYDLIRVDLTPASLAAAVREVYADPKERQNGSPSIAEFLAFAKRTGFRLAFEGYVVSPDRDDARISVEGVQLVGQVDDADRLTFMEWCAPYGPDEFDRDRAWWD